MRLSIIDETVTENVAMPAYSFLTIQSETTGLYREKGSKFLAFAYPVLHEEGIKEKLSILKKKYFDAQHHCYAWVLGSEKSQYRTYDDGEPSHTAGDPILGQIRAKNITQTLVVVVRYFGGTKLGTGGLTAAYRAAAADALQKATIIEETIKECWSFHFPYTALPEAMRLIKTFNLAIVKQDFGETCTLEVSLNVRDREALLDKINLMQAMNVPLGAKPC